MRPLPLTAKAAVQAGGVKSLLKRALGDTVVAQLRAWQGAPRRRVLQWVLARRARPEALPGGPALVIAPHPDDEVFATAGLLALKAQADARVGVAFLTSGEASHQRCCGAPVEEIARARRLLACEAGARLGLGPQAMHWLGLPDGRLPRNGQEGFATAVSAVAEVLRQAAPQEVYAPHPLDCWADHAAASEIVAQAVRRSGFPCAVHWYLVWGWYKLPLRRLAEPGLANAWKLDIAPVLSAKRQAIRCYRQAVAPRCGKPYIGVLPPGFAAPFEAPSEVFFTPSGATPASAGEG
ncbi:MAG TPA: PIG-L family deacetylase [Planctomycetota bacterium]|mgnify:CR=1 FL=1|nr:PIG-L family deacetylase [Planctomycetota bacterium]HRR80688.1 PIG-L family deacetylase [Planctomycetota bacterium]HRT93276.1 PIG-L family deacetylase [Planctomycetota bacterium]